MKLALYVHDLKLEIGHSNSLIELIRHLPEDYQQKIESIEVVSFTTSALENLFPDFRGKLSWTSVPFPGLKPVLFKSLFFQIWTYLYDQFRQTKETYRIGIGISSLNVDAVSTQFIHHQWTERGLSMERGHILRKLYKKILFGYFEWCENFLFSRKKIRIFSPAEFLTAFLKKHFPHSSGKTIYSGVNLSRFELGKDSKQQIFSELLTEYKSLQGLNVEQPIYLFVGAYERKGLHEALDLVKKIPGAQFIVIGSPSLGRAVEWPKEIKIFPITFTKKVSKFYSLSDVFVFPTLYEPFGLVLFEAMAMGLTIITRYSEVGASELLEGLPEIYFLDRPGTVFPEITVKDLEDRKTLRAARLSKLGDVSWTKAGKELAHYLSEGLV